MAIDIIARGMVESSKNDISQLFDITKGGETVSGESSYTISNAVDYPLLGLSLYGKSVQDGTPTPETPVDIVSVGDNGFDIISKDDTHFNLLSVRDNSSEIITKQPVSTAAKVGENAVFTVTTTGTGLTYQWQYSTNKGTTWNNTSNKTSAYNLTVKQAYNGFMYRCVVTDNSGKSVISDEATLYVVSDDCEIKTASIATDALPLCGIPVESGGNYTDSNGQMWICDELIYNADGTGKIVKYCSATILSASNITNIIKDDNYGNFFDTNIVGAVSTSTNHIKPLSNRFLGVTYADRVASDYINTFRCFISDIGHLLLRAANSENDKFSSLDDMRNFVDSNDVYIVYQLAEPQEIELTAADVSALMQLRTYSGMTEISNSGNADMDVKYCTDKALSEYVMPVITGLQKQIDELRAAILSMGGNV